MKTWNIEDAAMLTSPQEVQVITYRRDGSARRPTTIWIVRDGADVFVRSANGPTAAWFRAAIATRNGQIVARQNTFDVTFADAQDQDLVRVDAAYRAKYGQYASIVDHLEEEGPRSATLQVHPA